MVETAFAPWMTPFVGACAGRSSAMSVLVSATTPGAVSGPGSTAVVAVAPGGGLVHGATGTAAGAAMGGPGGQHSAPGAMHQGALGGLGGPPGMLVHCHGCDKPITDKFLLNVLERTWHSECVRCHDCLTTLQDKCFSREGKLFCRHDFYRRYGTKCSGCSEGISPSDLVRKARDKVFHLNCFTCLVCRKQLSTGEQLYVLDDNNFICKADYVQGKAIPAGGVGVGLGTGQPGLGSAPHLSHHPAHPHDTLLSASEDDEDDDPTSGGGAGTGGVGAPGGPPQQVVKQEPNVLNAAELAVATAAAAAVAAAAAAGVGPAGGTPGGGANAGDVSKALDDSEDQGSLDGDPETRDSQTENKSPEDGNSGSKRRGPRTTIKAKQLEILKTAFAQTPKPTRHIREQLAKETGLPMRVIQVWFQNKRSKERRLKQLTSMGRGPFFGGSRKMRGFPINLSPGLDEPPPGFPYFGDAGKFEFAAAAAAAAAAAGYGPPPGPPGPHPPPPGAFHHADFAAAVAAGFHTGPGGLDRFGAMDGPGSGHPGLGPPGPDFGPAQQGPPGGPGGPGGGGGGTGPGGTPVGPSGPGEVYSENSAAMAGMQRGPSPEFLQQGSFGEVQSEGLVW